MLSVVSQAAEARQGGVWIGRSRKGRKQSATCNSTEYSIQRGIWLAQCCTRQALRHMACGIHHAMRRRRSTEHRTMKYKSTAVDGSPFWQEQKTELLHSELSKAHSLKVSSSSMPTALARF